MTRRRSIFLLISLSILLPLAGGVLWSSAVGSSSPGESDSLFKYLGLFTEVLGLVRKEYVDPVDPERLVAGALEGAAEALGPGGVWVPAEAVDRYRAALEAGVAEVGLDWRKERGIPYVASVVEGSPAARAAIQPGSILAAIDGRSSRELPGWELVVALTGKRGEKRQLLLLERGKERKIELELEPLEFPRARLEGSPEAPILRIPALGPGSAAQIRAHLEEIGARKGSKLIVDLLGCSRGEAESAFAAASLWGRGELGRLVRRGEVLRTFSSEQEPVWNGELVVLVDSGTRGPCELLAGILRGRTGARLVGVKSFGSAGERELVGLPSGGKLHLTRAFYLPVSGTMLSEGLEPDVAVEDLAFGFGDRERSLPELIREIGTRVLRGEALPENLRS